MAPSINWWGLPSRIWRSLNVPGSDSSALTTTYLTGSLCGMKLHLTPVGKPAPPRPRKFEALTRSIVSGGVMLPTALRSAS